MIKKLDYRKPKFPKTEVIEHVHDIKKGELKGGKSYLAGYIWPSRYETKFNQIKKVKSGVVYDRRGEDLIHKVFLEDRRIILSPNKTYTLIIDYPLNVPYTEEIKSGKEGVTLREVLNIAVDAYRKIYKEEAKTSKLKEESISKRTKGASKLINRAETNGKYGIWGHRLEDLTIINIMVKGNKIYLGVDS
jgi:hypothetical protein